MTQAKRLRPKRPGPVATPQCCVPISQFHPGSVPRHYIRTRAAKLEKYSFDPNLCSHHATVEIEGKNYCTRHAGVVALAIVLGEKHE